MVKKNGSKKKKSESTPNSVDIHVGGNLDNGNIVVGDNNVVNNYFQIVEKNTKQNDPDYWNLKHPYPMPPNFTGRLAERTMLTQWLEDDFENRLFILRALGGFGKSALAWQWLTHDVNPKSWKKVVFWSFYEGDASFEHFVEETLKYLNLEVSSSKRDQVDTLLHAMQADNILLIMDGFERALRAYNGMNAAYQGDEEPKLNSNQLDCVDINAEWFLKGVCALPNMKSKVLMTTRLIPRVLMVGSTRELHLQGCRETELTAMQRTDAIEFFHKQGIKGTRFEIETACETYGNHPLSLRLLAGRILNDLYEPGDISVAQHIKTNGDIKRHQDHLLKNAYKNLSIEQKKLLTLIACFRSSIETKHLIQIIKNLETKSVFRFFKKILIQYRGEPDYDLNELFKYGLIQKTATKNGHILDMHSIVRHYVYNRLTRFSRTAFHETLVSYYDNTIPETLKAEKLEELKPIIEMYHHLVNAGKPDQAFGLHEIFLMDILFNFAAYQTLIELLLSLFLDGVSSPPRLKKVDDRLSVLNEIAVMYSLTGQSELALKFHELANKINKNKINRKMHYWVFDVQTDMMRRGSLLRAEQIIQNNLDECKNNDNRFSEGIARIELGQILSYRGQWHEAEQELNLAITLLNNVEKDEKEMNALNWIGQAFSHLALHYIFVYRSGDNKPSINLAFDKLDNANIFMEKHSEAIAPMKREYIYNYWLIGMAHRINNELEVAEYNLSRSINMCRQSNLIVMEADILLELAQLRYAQGDFKDAQEKASEALMITERCGYVLQGADVNLFLAQYALEQEKDKAKAKVYAEEAKKLATCDGPPYYYKVAYEEAERFLEKLAG